MKQRQYRLQPPVFPAMKLSDFNYELPADLIAQSPAAKRDQSRLLVLNRQSSRLEHRRFFNVVEYLEKGDVLVINDSKVIPARLIGKKVSGGKVEIFLSKPVHGQKSKTEIWECLIKGKHIRPETEVIFSKTFKATILSKDGDVWMASFNKQGLAFQRALSKYGLTPLPPYIKPGGAEDKKRYQTVYAENTHAGSVAAPTAGLHFTPQILKQLKKKGVVIKKITLHVGLGTFLPVRVSNIKKHRMHGEWVEVSADVKKAINAAHAHNHKVVAVGTTSVRSLEAAFIDSSDKSFKASVEIFIYPSFKFKVVDALITNFHLPESTLLMLVSAFASRKKILNAYEAAIKEKYRFYSYGDAMLIL